MEISKLSVKCLVEMPMLLDVINKTVNELKDSIEPYFEKYLSFLEKTVISEKLKNGYKYVDLKRKGAFELIVNSLENNISIYYNIDIIENKTKNPTSFQILFGYLMDPTQNVLFFQISETTLSKNKTAFFLELGEKIKNEKQKVIEFECIDDEDSLCFQFEVDETLSIEKIKQCSDTFKEQILIPLIEKLQN